MNINIKLTGIEQTEAISDYTRRRAQSLLGVVGPDSGPVSVTVELGKTTRHHKSGNVFRCEINFHIGGKTLRSVSEKDDLYAAIDDAKEEMSEEIVSFRDKKRTLFRRGGYILKQLAKGAMSPFTKIRLRRKGKQ